MNNWYTVAIAFLGGAVLGLLAFLFYQPASSTTNSHNTDRQAETEHTDVTASDSEAEPKANNADDQETEAADGGPKKSASWKEEEENSEEKSDTSTTIPHLIFYYKPGWPLCQSTKDIVDGLRPKYVGEVKITYIPEGSKRGIEGEKKYNIPHGMVLLDKNKEVFWKKKGLRFSRSTVKSKLDAILNNE